jgi:hypothetical protein
VSPLKKMPVAIPATSQMMKNTSGMKIARLAAFLFIEKAVL